MKCASMETSVHIAELGQLAYALEVTGKPHESATVLQHAYSLAIVDAVCKCAPTKAQTPTQKR